MLTGTGAASPRFHDECALAGAGAGEGATSAGATALRLAEEDDDESASPPIGTGCTGVLALLVVPLDRMLPSRLPSDRVISGKSCCGDMKTPMNGSLSSKSGDHRCDQKWSTDCSIVVSTSSSGLEGTVIGWILGTARSDAAVAEADLAILAPRGPC